MKNTPETLYDQYAKDLTVYRSEYAHIHYTTKRLKKELTPRQKKLLLKIQDNQDLIAEKTSRENFACGVKVGVQLLLDIFYPLIS